MRKLEALRLKYPDHISEVRGKGLMIGFEFKKGIAKGTASEVTNACMQHGMFLLTCSAFEVVRFIPPLNATAEEIDMGVAMFEKALEDVLGAK
jgi:4-aminobutyrate aminotransferase